MFTPYIQWLPKAWQRYVARRFSRTQCADLDALVVPSSAMQQVLTDYGVTTPMTILPTGLDMQVFGSGDGAAFRAQHGIPAGRPVILFVGRVAFEKNIGFLLAVTERLRQQIPDILLVIAGEGPAEKSLHLQVKRRGLAGNVVSLATCAGMVICRRATRPQMCSCSLPAPKPRGWC